MISKLLLLSPFLLLLLRPSASYQGDGWYKNAPIENVSDPHVQYIGSFAVDEYDKSGNPHIYFIEVINATIYRSDVMTGVLTTWTVWLKAKNCSHSGPPEMYEAQVYELYVAHFHGDPGVVQEPYTTYSFEYLKLLWT